MVKAVFDELEPSPNRTTSRSAFKTMSAPQAWSLIRPFDRPRPETFQAIFWGLGSDGTGGRNKNSIKIIGEETDNYAQGYFVYDSKKSGSITISHLRYGPQPIHSHVPDSERRFHRSPPVQLLEQHPVLAEAGKGATLLLNSPFGPDDIREELPRAHPGSGHHEAAQTLRGGRLSHCSRRGHGRAYQHRDADLLLRAERPYSEGRGHRDDQERPSRKSYGKRGEAVVQRIMPSWTTRWSTWSRSGCQEARRVSWRARRIPCASGPSQALPTSVIARDIACRGDQIPVSAMPADGTYPTGTSEVGEEKHRPVPSLCGSRTSALECGKCVLVCPHSVIRAKVARQADLADAPDGFKTMPAKWRELPDQQYTIQVSADDCTGCELCVQVCPVEDKTQKDRKALNMRPEREVHEK